MPTLGDIDNQTRKYSDDRNDLANLVTKLEAELEAVKRAHLPAIRRAAGRTSNSRGKLSATLEQSPDRFVKPRTLTLHGVKVGFAKKPGKMVCDDEQVVKLIHRHFKAQADVLIKTTEKPVKKSLENLSAKDLKRLGVAIEDDSDEVVIRATDSAIDKLVDALLKDGEDK